MVTGKRLVRIACLPTILGMVFSVLTTVFASAQNDSTPPKLSFTGDFRFRIEQDWDSRRSDGSYRDDRSRLRYRVRFGLDYRYNNWADFGIRLRTGENRKQQDPHLTLGEGFKEFDLVPIGLEKLFFRAHYKVLTAWLGKNTFPFQKQNELFWSDNVYPEGVFAAFSFPVDSRWVQTLRFNAGHFILGAKGSSFKEDRFFQGFQVHTTHTNNRLDLFPGIFYFHDMPDVPDGNEQYQLDYLIFHFGASIRIIPKPQVTAMLDYYHNLEDLQGHNAIPQQLNDQDQGLVIGTKLGNLEQKGDWILQVTYAYLQRFAAVDFLAQNDWARWDYGLQGSPDGRLTNLQGVEVVMGYAVGAHYKFQMRFYKVQQLVASGPAKETGSRIRLDLDIGF